MGKFITMNYSGVYVIEPRQVLGKDPSGMAQYSTEIAIRPTKLGVTDDGKVIGMFDTETQLPQEMQEEAERRWGKGWLKTLDEKIEKGPYNLRYLRPGETITINDIDIQPANPGDKAKLPKSKRATVLQGPITAAAMVGDVARVKLENKQLPAPTEKVQE